MAIRNRVTPRATNADQEAPSNLARSEREVMGGLAKGLAIIEVFGAEHPQLTVTDAANATSVSPAAARRCLLTLASLGYVSYDGKYFRPTPRMGRLRGAYNSVSLLPSLAQPCLDAVRDEVAESCSLAVLDGEYATFIARAEAKRMVTTSVRLGAQLPAHLSASGRVLLASLSDDELADYLDRHEPTALTPNTLTSRGEIRDRIVAVRRTGVEYMEEELEVGIRAMAVPVRDVAGTTHAAMSLAGLASRVSRADMVERFTPVLMREAALLGSML